MDLTRPQLCLMRTLLKRGWEQSLTDTMLLRCGAARQDWDALVEAGLIASERNLWTLTEAGRLAFRRRPANIYF